MASVENDGSNKQNSADDVQEETDIYHDEINLRAYVQVIIKRKKLIVGMFLIAVIAAVIVSLLLPKVYEASASIMVIPSRTRAALSATRGFLDPETTEKGDYVEQKPAISVPAHRILLKSNDVLERVMKKLASAGKLDKDLELDDLSEKLKIAKKPKKGEETSIFRLMVEDNDPALARDIANIWADEYAQYSLELITGDVTKAGKFVEAQFELFKGNLVAAEQAVKDFDSKERLSLMEIQLKENNTQLESHYAKVHKFEFALKEKQNQLKKIEDDIVAMAKDGTWIGSFNVKKEGEKNFADETLSLKQKALRQKALKAKLELENQRIKRDGFVNDSKIMLLRANVEDKRKILVSDKARLAQIKQLDESTRANLKSKTNLDMLKSLQGPIAENLPELTIWEILSLTKEYNFFETRRKALLSKLEQQEKELKASEKNLFEYNDTLKNLDDNLDRAQDNYDFYHSRFKALKGQRNSLETKISEIDFDLSYSKKMVQKLEGQVKALKIAIDRKKLKLAELNRQLDICEKAYAIPASKIEEVRLAKTMELGEVKVVSAAFKPELPVSPNKKLIVAITGAAGLMLGVFVAFCLEFWKKDEKSNS